MTTVQDVKDVLLSVGPVLDNISADADKQINKIADLQAIIAAGGTVTAEQLQELHDIATGTKLKADSIDVKVS